jgi:uncharacterized membrane protein YecN with MAPEG domain
MRSRVPADKLAFMATPTMPVVTALYGGLNALFNIYLANRVSTARRTQKVSIGHGDSDALLLAARTHANNAEFVPLGILVLLLSELCGGSSFVLHVLGGSLLVGRVFHMIGMPMKAPNFFRFAGTALTWTMIAATAVYLLWLRMKA